jgi:7,8-dihydropterin-6-yl-methyl-4-(beta-D-ribofuranosyl)aminobenzene 5'-phosphate synthase
MQRALESVKRLKVTTLADNLTYHGSLLGQWGLSFLLEVEDKHGKVHKIIIDSAAEKNALLFNIDRLKINLRDLEAIVLSHGHRDHTATTVELAKRSRRRVQVFAHPHTFKGRYLATKKGKKWSRVPKGERIEDLERVSARVILSREPHGIIPGVMTTGEIPRLTSYEKIPGKRFIVVEGRSQRDHILDDQSLIVNVRGQGAWVLSGCAHSGIVNTLRRVKEISPSSPIHAVVGGFHLVSKKEHEIKPIIDALKAYRPKLISPCHCTGFLATGMIWDAFEKEFILNFSGRTIDSRKMTQPRLI